MNFQQSSARSADPQAAPSIQASLDGILQDLHRLHDQLLDGRPEAEAVDAVIGQMADLGDVLVGRRVD